MNRAGTVELRKGADTAVLRSGGPPDYGSVWVCFGIGATIGSHRPVGSPGQAPLQRRCYMLMHDVGDDDGDDDDGDDDDDDGDMFL